MIDPTRIYHIGFVVPNLRTAMQETTASLGYRWSKMRELAGDILVPGGPRPSTIRVAFTQDGPPWIEFIESQDPVWKPERDAVLHHVGFYVDDLAEEKRRLEGLGFAFEAGSLAPDGGVSGFAYMRSPISGRVELVDQRLRGSIERMIAAGI
jgi:hypothetical protein